MKNKIKAILFAGVLMLATVLAGSVTVKAETPEIKYSGTDGGVKWSIDENGQLLLTGDGDYVGSPDWLQYDLEIISAVIAVKNMTRTTNMFMGCKNMVGLTIDGFDTSKVTDMSFMFYRCSSLTSLDLSKFDTSNVTDMCCMFLNCKSLTSLDLSKFDTSNVTNMRSLFYGCSSLTSLDLSKFNTSKVTTMRTMFAFCSSLMSFDFRKFDTSNVTDMRSMFYDCASLTNLDVSKFETNNVTDMSGLFYGCTGLTSLDLSKFDTSNVMDMSYMFHSCTGLTSLDLSSFNTSKVADTRYMFYDCPSITSLDLSSWDLSSLEYSDLMLYGMDGLVRISLPQSPVEIKIPGGFCEGENGTYTLQAYAESYCGMNGHTYSSPVFTWADDYSSAKIYMECTREDCAYDIDDKYVQMDAVVAKEVINSTTEKEGATVYTATAVHKGKTYTDVKSVSIPKLPQQPTQPQNPEQSQQPTAKPVGTSVKTTTMFFRVTKAGKTPELAYMGPKNKKVKKVTIPATVKIDGVTYKVTSVATGALKNYKKLTTVTIGKNVTKIGKNAFYGCKKLKKIVIKSKKLKSVGKNAFKGIQKNATIDVPNSKKKAYKKLFTANTGFKKKTMKVK